MAFDTGQQEAAQRYYIQALRLARAAADVPLGGYVLASMSLQATYRGFADEGVDLAQAAVERNRGLATARTMSFFRLVEARAHAKANDAAAAGSALKAAEGWLERSRDGDADPSWLGFYSYDRFAADAAECHLDLKAPRQVRRFTEQALSRPTEEFVRSHGLRLVVSAVAELESGNLDAACAAGTRAVEVAWPHLLGPDHGVRTGPAAPARTVRTRAARRRAAGAGPAAPGGARVTGPAWPGGGVRTVSIRHLSGIRPASIRRPSYQGP